MPSTLYIEAGCRRFPGLHCLGSQHAGPPCYCMQLETHRWLCIGRPQNSRAWHSTHFELNFEPDPCTSSEHPQQPREIKHFVSPPLMSPTSTFVTRLHKSCATSLLCRKMGGESVPFHCEAVRPPFVCRGAVGRGRGRGWGRGGAGLLVLAGRHHVRGQAGAGGAAEDGQQVGEGGPAAGGDGEGDAGAPPPPSGANPSLPP